MVGGIGKKREAGKKREVHHLVSSLLEKTTSYIIRLRFLRQITAVICLAKVEQQRERKKRKRECYFRVKLFSHSIAKVMTMKIEMMIMMLIPIADDVCNKHDDE